MNDKQTRILTVCVSLCIMLLSFASIYVESSDFQYQTYVRIIETDDGEIIEEEIDARNYTTYDEIMNQMSIDFFALKEKNDDLVGWLNIPNIGYYPIVMGDDNQYYLKRDINKKYSSAGTLFMNTACEGSFSDIALIHGHRMKNGSMFGSLTKYRDEEFFNNNDLITVFDGKYLYIYQPFSVTLYEDGTDYHKWGLPSIARKEYLQSIKDESMVELTKDIKINLDNQVLMLSTCEYSFENARLLVSNVMIDKIKYDY